MPRWLCGWIGGGIILAGALCQAAEGFWPNRGVSTQGKVPLGGNLPPPLDHPSPFSLASQNGPVGDQASAEETFRENPLSEDRHSRSGQSAGVSETGLHTVESGDSHPVPAAEGNAPNGSPPARPAPLRLGAPTQSSPLSGASSGQGVNPRASTLTVLSSLAVVLGVFLLVVWAIRRAMPRPAQPLPKEVVEVLGRAPLMGRQQMYLLRCGPKLLLVSVTPEGAETLTEIDHPDEVARITALCRQGQAGSISHIFQKVLDQMAHEKPVRGRFGRSTDVEVESADRESPAQEESAHV